MMTYQNIQRLKFGRAGEQSPVLVPGFVPGS